MIRGNSKRVFLLVTFLTLGTACGNTVETDIQQPQPTSTAENPIEGDTFTDRYGNTWRKINDIDEYVPFDGVEPKEIEDPRDFKPFDEMTIQEIADRFRPILERNKNVYALDPPRNLRVD
jgi:hypothetical protein